MFRVHVQRRHRLGPAGERRAQRPEWPARTCGWHRSSVRPPAQAITVTVDNSEDLRLPTQTIIDLGLQKTFQAWWRRGSGHRPAVAQRAQRGRRGVLLDVDPLPGTGLLTLVLGQPETVAGQGPADVLRHSADGGARRRAAPLPLFRRMRSSPDISPTFYCGQRCTALSGAFSPRGARRTVEFSAPHPSQTRRPLPHSHHPPRRVRLRAPRVEILTAHGTSQPSLRYPVR